MDIEAVFQAEDPDPVETLQASDGRAPCPTCGKSFKVSADGSLRKHKCVEGITEVESTKPRKRVVKGKAPAGVRRLMVSTAGGATEWGAGIAVSRAVPCTVDEVPEEVITLPDAEAMIGPIVDGLWPQMPPGVQKVLVALSDKEDLIAAMFAWIEYTNTLKSWAAAERARRENEVKSHGESVEIPTTIAGYRFLGGTVSPLDFPTADSSL